MSFIIQVQIIYMYIIHKMEKLKLSFMDSDLLFTWYYLR